MKSKMFIFVTLSPFYITWMPDNLISRRQKLNNIKPTNVNTVKEDFYMERFFVCLTSVSAFSP